MIRVPTDQPHVISGSFDCLDTRVSTDPVRVALYNAAEKVVWESRGTAEGSFSLRGTGKHWLCLENGLTYEQDVQYEDEESSRRTDPRMKIPRTIGFALRVKRSTTGAGEGNGDSSVDKTTEQLLQLTEELNENFDVLTNHMSFMKAREMYHRALHEETFSKVVWWNILEICGVVVVTFGQVMNVWWILKKRNSGGY